MVEQTFVTFDQVPRFLGTHADGRPLVTERWVRSHWRREGMPGTKRAGRVLFYVPDLIEWGRGRRYDMSAR